MTSTVAPTAPVFRERLWPAPWLSAAGALLAAMCGLVVYPFGIGPSAVVTPIAFVVVGTLLSLWAPVVAVRGGELVAGRAHVPVGLLGEVVALDAAATRAELGPKLDARAFLCIRGWVRTGVRVELTDPGDPTPYWLVSTRRPEALAAALVQARDAA